MRYVSKENLSQFWGGVKSWLNDKFTITKNKITDWPSTFPPSSHTHTISQITDLQNQLNGKSSTSHNHDGRYLRVGYIGDKGGVSKTVGTNETVYVTLPDLSDYGVIYKYSVSFSRTGKVDDAGRGYIRTPSSGTYCLGGSIFSHQYTWQITTDGSGSATVYYYRIS